LCRRSSASVTGRARSSGSISLPSWTLPAALLPASSCRARKSQHGVCLRLPDTSLPHPENHHFSRRKTCHKDRQDIAILETTPDAGRHERQQQIKCMSEQP
jgi:hypothetical protein